MKVFILIGSGLSVLSPLLAVAVGPSTHPQDYPGPAWSPYLVGALIGVLSMLTFYFSDKPLGASTAYARLAGILGRVVAPQHTDSLKFYHDNKPAVDWEVMLVLGAILGAFLAAWMGDELTGVWLSPMWVARFGEGSLLLRLGSAVGGGILMAFGARLAGGCTSGHGISGTLQLSVGSWIAVICFFIGGIATAMLLFRL
ncbi:MAG: YeeE/YedE thiosulfate transporter family protein [Pirellulaceae bacterium]